MANSLHRYYCQLPFSYCTGQPTCKPLHNCMSLSLIFVHRCLDEKNIGELLDSCDRRTLKRLVICVLKVRGCHDSKGVSEISGMG